MAVSKLTGTGRGWALSFIVLYMAVAVLPMAAAALLGARGEPRLLVAGLMVALAGYALLCLQVLLAARIKAFERPFGLDIVYRFHRNMGILALVLLISHPFFLAAAGGGIHLLIGLKLPWTIWVGKITLVLLLANVLLSVYQKRLGVGFEGWRAAHDILGPLILVFGFVHALALGEDMHMPLLTALWVILFAGAVILFAYHRLARPVILKLKAYRVEEVKPETPGVWTVKISPPPGGRVHDHLPGQFHFITFYRNRGLPVEEHHWTISSSPAQDTLVGSTIKALGDFTATMGETRAGDLASVQGAFGRFSHLLHPEETDLVFAAGGIGITPVMSMLRYMQDVNDIRDVLLLYGNRNVGEIVFRDELARMEAGGHPRLTVVHVLSSPDKGWTGENGFVDGEKIMRYCHEDLKGKAFYLCGPKGMLDALTASLKAMGVPEAKIRTEIFSFLD